MVKNYAHLLASPVTAIFNSSLREGKLLDLWKTATIVPVPKKHPPGSLENDIRPISLTPILAKVFEGIVLNRVDDEQSVKIGDTVSSIGYPNGGVPQRTLSGPKNFLVQINDLQTPCPMFKYVDDSTVFDVCNNSSVPMLQESADIISD